MKFLFLSKKFLETSKMLSGHRDTDLLILLKLDDPSLFQISRCCKYTAELCRNTDFWKRKLLEKFEIVWSNENYNYDHPRNLYLQLNTSFRFVYFCDQNTGYVFDYISYCRYRTDHITESPFYYHRETIFVPKYIKKSINFYIFFPCAPELSFVVTLGEGDDVISIFQTKNIEKFADKPTLTIMCKKWIICYRKSPGQSCYIPLDQKEINQFIKLGIYKPEDIKTHPYADVLYIF